MFAIKKKSLMLSVVLMFTVLLMGCVVESQDRLFKKPTKKDLDSALNDYVNISYEHSKAKRYDLAMMSVKRALDINSRSAMANNALALVYQHQGEMDQAEKSFKKALSYDSKFSVARMSYGNFLFAQKKYMDACKQYEKASSDSFYVQRADAFFNLGLCKEKVGDINAAEIAYRRCLGIDVNYVKTLLRMSFIQFEKNRLPVAKKLFDQYAKLNREQKKTLTPDALLLGIKLEQRFGNKDKEASMALFLKNIYPYSKEYLEYKDSLEK